MDYKNAKVYQIVDNGYNMSYIGSTCMPLSKRFHNHKSLYNFWKNHNKGFCTSFYIFDEYGVENCKIELIEAVPCLTKDELRKKEGEFIKKNRDCVNKRIDGRTVKEYREDNKDKIKEIQKEYYDTNKDKINEYQKEYRDDNKDKIKEYRDNNKDKIKEYFETNKDKYKELHKEYYETNKDKIKQIQKEYRETNKDKIKEYQNTKNDCVCGGVYSNSGKARHLKTKKHQSYLNNNN